jgi:hypothetical protein
MGIVESSVVALSGFGPMAVVLYLGLRPHAEKFEYPRSTMMLLIGIIAGVFLAVGHILAEAPATNAAGLLVVEAILSLIATLLVLAVFNRVRFAGKHSTPFFAAVLGAGLGSMIPVSRAYPFALNPAYAGSLFSPEIMLPLIALSFTQVAARASAAALVGYGVYTRQVREFTAYGAAVLIATYAILVPGMAQPPPPATPDFPMIGVSFGAAMAFALVCWAAVAGALFPRCAPPPEKKARKEPARGMKEERSAAGAGAGEATGAPKVDILAGSTSVWRTGK